MSLHTNPMAKIKKTDPTRSWPSYGGTGTLIYYFRNAKWYNVLEKHFGSFLKELNIYIHTVKYT